MSTDLEDGELRRSFPLRSVFLAPALGCRAVRSRAVKQHEVHWVRVSGIGDAGRIFSPLSTREHDLGRKGPHLEGAVRAII